MHDPTEGGVAGGIHELADASGLGVRIFKDKILVFPETAEICRFFEIDPLQLIGSGALLISAHPESAEGIVCELTNHCIRAAVIGEFTKNPLNRILIRHDGVQENLVRPICDHLWSALNQ
jgi:hydrogenase expression/formation protein HypE